MNIEQQTQNNTFEVKSSKKKTTQKKTYYIPTDIQKKIDWLSKNSDNKNSSRLLCELITLEYEKQNQHNKDHQQKVEGVVDDSFMLQTLSLENEELKSLIEEIKTYLSGPILNELKKKNDEIEGLKRNQREFFSAYFNLSQAKTREEQIELKNRVVNYLAEVLRRD